MIEPKEAIILVVDDEPILRKAISNDLKRQGYQVLVAGSGNEGFEMVKANKIDVILSDIRMPNGDGIQLLKNIKILSPNTPVLMFITGFSDLSLQDAYDEGAEAVFSKPFDRKVLLAAVEKALCPKEELWGEGSRSEATNFQLCIDLKFPELKTALQTHVLNLGRGGMFVALGNQLPKVHDQVEFKIAFEKDSPSVVHGRGIVRWVRNVATNQPSGCGIEFTSLDANCRAQLIQILNNAKTKSFIPKA
jgi:CheY-like chemotaxis protein